MTLALLIKVLVKKECCRVHFTIIDAYYVWILHTLVKEVWVHKTNLTPSRFSDVPAPSYESERICIAVLWLSILSLYDFFIGF